MEELKQSSISKSRSYTACLSEAHKMLFDNIRRIFGRTWMFVTVLSLLTASYASLYLHAGLHGFNATTAVCLAIVSVLMLCAEVAYYARLTFLVNGRPMIWNIRRSANLALLYICFCILLGIVYSCIFYFTAYSVPQITPDKAMPLLAGIGISTAIIALLMLPFVYVAIKYMMEPEFKLRKSLFKSYVTGLKHWGLIFIALLLTTLCVTVCAVLVSIPALIVMAANIYSVFGVNFLGDPSGLPSYFPAIQFVVFAMSSFICLYINIFTVFVCYFLYGSIETREKEKQEFLAKKQQGK